MRASLVGELGRALLQKGLDSFFLVLRGHAGNEQGALVVNSRCLAYFQCVLDSALGEASCDLGFLCDFAS